MKNIETRRSFEARKRAERQKKNSGMSFGQIVCLLLFLFVVLCGIIVALQS